MNPTFRHATWAAVLFSLLLVAFTVHAKTASEVYEQAARSTVVVENIDTQGKVQSMGSGVVLADGNVVTNCHVVKGANRLTVRSGDEKHPATLRYSDWDRDVCSLSSAGLIAPAAVVGSTKTLKVGAKVYAIGAPKGLELTLSDGIVSSLRPVDGGHYIQTTAAISPGSSGGGLFDENGALVGLTTFYLSEGQNLNFAVPVEWVKELAKRSVRAPAVAQPVTQWLNKAIDLGNHEDWPALLEHTLRWTKAQPDSDMAWFNLGYAYAKVGQSAKAVEADQEALRINPEHAGAWLNLGYVYAKARQSTKAIHAFKKALSINPEDAMAWNNMGAAYDEDGQPAKAIDAFQRALRINPRHAYFWYNLGNAYTNSGQLTKAIEAYQQALSINPEFADTWLKLGDVYDEADQSEEAVKAYQRALRINSGNASGWINLGVTYAKARQSAKATEAFHQALRIDPENASTWNNLGGAYNEAGQFVKAIEALQQALRINPEHAGAWYNLGNAYAQSGQRGKVLKVYKQLKILDPALAEEFFSKVVMR